MYPRWRLENTIPGVVRAEQISSTKISLVTRYMCTWVKGKKGMEEGGKETGRQSESRE